MSSFRAANSLRAKAKLHETSRTSLASYGAFEVPAPEVEELADRFERERREPAVQAGTPSSL